MICRNCGAEIKEGSGFCGNCGMKAEAAQNSYGAPEQNYYQEPNNGYQAQGYYQPPVYSQPPVYPRQQFVPVEKPNTTLWIVLTAIELAVCSMIPGIVGLVYAILANSAADKGDYYEAEKKIRTAKTWFWVGLALGIVVYIIAFIVGILEGIYADPYYW